MTNFVLVPDCPRKPDILTEAEFFALYPLYSLMLQRARNRNPKFDWSLSRDDLLNGRNGIPPGAGARIVFTLLTVTGKYVDISGDQQSFRINERGARAVAAYKSAGMPESARGREAAHGRSPQGQGPSRPVARPVRSKPRSGDSVRTEQ